MQAVVRTKLFQSITGREANRASTRLKIIILLGLVVLTLLLCSCGAAPGGTMCQGNSCNSSVQINDNNPSSGLDWFIGWAFSIIKGLITAVGVAATQVGIWVFWALFGSIASTDFQSCSGGATSTATCATVNAFNQIRTIGLILVPLLLTWKIAKNYFIGAFIPAIVEGGLAIAARFVIAMAVLSQMPTIFSWAFGLDNLLFEAIMGSPTGLLDLTRNIIGNNNQGVLSFTGIQDLGLCFFLNGMGVIMGIVFVLLGIIFLLRTIVIFILFAMSPLAVMGFLSDEFKPYYFKWFNSVMGLLVAPLPVAVCFRLILNYATNIPNAHNNPGQMFLMMVYVESFAIIGGIMMFKIAGQAGQLMFGIMAAALGALVGGIAGGAMAKGAGGKSEGAATPTSGSEASNTGGAARTAVPNTTASPSLSGASHRVVDGQVVGSTANNYAPTAPRRDDQLAKTLRSLNQQLTAQSHRARYDDLMAQMYRTPRYNYSADRTVQGLLHGTAEAVGLDAPHLSFAHSGNAKAGTPTPQKTPTEEAAAPAPTEQTEEAKPPSALPGASEPSELATSEASPPLLAAQNGTTPPAPASDVSYAEVDAQGRVVRQYYGAAGQSGTRYGAGGTSNSPIIQTEIITPPVSSVSRVVISNGNNPNISPMSNRAAPLNTYSDVLTDPYGNSEELPALPPGEGDSFEFNSGEPSSNSQADSMVFGSSASNPGSSDGLVFGNSRPVTAGSDSSDFGSNTTASPTLPPAAPPASQPTPASISKQPVVEPVTNINSTSSSPSSTFASDTSQSVSAISYSAGPTSELTPPASTTNPPAANAKPAKAKAEVKPQSVTPVAASVNATSNPATDSFDIGNTNAPVSRASEKTTTTANNSGSSNEGSN